MVDPIIYRLFFQNPQNKVWTSSVEPLESSLLKILLKTSRIGAGDRILSTICGNLKTIYWYLFNNMKGHYPRLITNRDKIFQLTGKRIPLTRKKKNGSEYIVTPRPICSRCETPVRKLYHINRYYRKLNVPRFEHVGYRCPKCDVMFSRRLVAKPVEEFEGDI